MPTTDDENSCRYRRVSRRLYFYSPPLSGSVDAPGVKTGQLGEPDFTTRSRADGTYGLDLAPGTYTVLVEDGGGAYCGVATDQWQCPVIVGAGSPTRHDPVVNHASD